MRTSRGGPQCFDLVRASQDDEQSRRWRKNDGPDKNNIKMIETLTWMIARV